MGAGGIAVLLAGLFFLLGPTGRIPLLDANRQVLAETAAEAYCAGKIYIQSYGRGDVHATEDCRATTARPTEIDWASAQEEFCFGVIAKGIAISSGECKRILAQSLLWPVMDGRLSNSWNRKFPYPGDFIITPEPSDSRTGDRPESDRVVPFRE
jgi:hypothetical protein